MSQNGVFTYFHLRFQNFIHCALKYYAFVWFIDTSTSLAARVLIRSLLVSKKNFGTQIDVKGEL